MVCHHPLIPLLATQCTAVIGQRLSGVMLGRTPCHPLADILIMRIRSGIDNAVRRLVEDGDIGRMPIRHYVAGVSAGIVAETPMLDLQYSEDSRAQVDLNCIMNELGEIIEIQGTGEGRAFSLQEQQALVELCAKGNRELIRKQKELLGDILR